MLLLALKVEEELLEKVFDGEVAAETKALWIEGEADAGTTQVFGQLKHLLLKEAEQVLINSSHPLLQLKWSVFVVEVDFILSFEALLEIDEGVVLGRTQEVHHLVNCLTFLGRAKAQVLLDHCTGILPHHLPQLSPRVRPLHLHNELLRHKNILSLQSPLPTIKPITLPPPPDYTHLSSLINILGDYSRKKKNMW